MENFLDQDNRSIEAVLNSTVKIAMEYLSGLEKRAAGMVQPSHFSELPINHDGIGVEEVLSIFKNRYEPWISGSAGPRYFGYIIGGVTPAALAGDWLTSVYDQNALGSDESISARIELDTIALLCDFFGLSSAFSGAFVSGATMSNFVGLALGRQWLGHQLHIDVAQQGLGGLQLVNVLSATPHSSVYKVLSMLGIGRDALKHITCLPDREAIDVAALEEMLKKQNGHPCIVVANAGTLNTVDFDDLCQISALKEQYSFWLHVDAAFGGFAACSSNYNHLVDGINHADSLTIDAHKWLNVPYDAAIHFTRHQKLQAEVFQNNASYLGDEIGPGNFVHLTPENSRRLRALPTLFTLLAYGKNGYAQIVEENCRLAGWLGNLISNSEQFELLSPVRMNGICFTLKSNEIPVGAQEIKNYLLKLKKNGGVFLTPTTYQSLPAIRASISNWRTTKEDMVTAWEAMQQCIIK